MQNAVPAGTGSMAAIIGMESEKLQKYCEDFSHEDIRVVIANRNCPGQYVISGHSEAVQLLMQAAQKAGALIFPLAVSAPFHSPLMQKAADDLAAWLESITFSDTRVPLINNAEAEFLQKAGDLKASLIRQVMAPVLWENSMRRLIAQGVENFVEIGPGKVLSGLMKRIDKRMNIINISDTASLENAIAQLAVS
jgi:[acyl-carrier-protein] S-malonyltransferase